MLKAEVRNETKERRERAQENSNYAAALRGGDEITHHQETAQRVIERQEAHVSEKSD